MMEPMSNLEMALQPESDPEFAGGAEKVGSDFKYQSDHNAVYGYFPNLIDKKYNVAIFTYNEKGNTCDLNGVNQFLKDCAGLGSADIIIAGIQEGDPSLEFINTIRTYKKDSVDRNVPDGVFTYSAGIKVSELDLALTDDPDEPEWDDMGMKGGGGERVRQAVYKSFGKECSGKGSLLCLVNGIYVIIPEKSRLGDGAGNNVPLNIQTGVKPVMTGYSKHMAWACIDTGASQTVFFSCHLEYSGDAKHVESGYKFSARAKQLDGYLAELTGMFPGAGAYICLGDTNMRTIYATEPLNGQTGKTVYMLDQMLYYLFQESYINTSLNDQIIGMYTQTYNGVRGYIDTTDITRINVDTTFSDISKGTVSIACGRYAILNVLAPLILEKVMLSCNALYNESYNYTNTLLSYGSTSSEIRAKLHNMWQYATKDGIADDPYAGYCLNPEFNINGGKYMAYDFTYKPIIDESPIKNLTELYSYGPTAIFTPQVVGMDGSREFDSAKRAKSGGLLGPSHTDRILMFVPKLDKIKFISLAE